MGTVGSKQILILGGGFGGLTVAMELETKLALDPSIEITVVNRENFFLFTPMLHEVATSDLDVAEICSRRAGLEGKHAAWPECHALPDEHRVSRGPRFCGWAKGRSSG